jgi:hypothetical protein
MKRTAAAVGLITTMMIAWMPWSTTSARFQVKSCFARAAGMAENDVAAPVLAAAARVGADFLATAMKVPPFLILQTGLQPGEAQGSGAHGICSNRA